MEIGPFIVDLPWSTYEISGDFPVRYGSLPGGTIYASLSRSSAGSLVATINSLPRDVRIQSDDPSRPKVVSRRNGWFFLGVRTVWTCSFCTTYSIYIYIIFWCLHYLSFTSFHHFFWQYILIVRVLVCEKESGLLIGLDDGKIYRNPLYLMVKTTVSCRFSQQNQSIELQLVTTYPVSHQLSKLAPTGGDLSFRLPTSHGCSCEAAVGRQEPSAGATAGGLLAAVPDPGGPGGRTLLGRLCGIFIILHYGYLWFRDISR